MWIACGRALPWKPAPQSGTRGLSQNEAVLPTQTNNQHAASPRAFNQRPRKYIRPYTFLSTRPAVRSSWPTAPSLRRPNQPWPAKLNGMVAERVMESDGGLAAIAVEGPKGVGKTRTAKRRGAPFFDLSEPATLELVQGEPARVTTAQTPVVIDEWQCFPPVWDVVRRAVDDDPAPGSTLMGFSRGRPASPRSRGTVACLANSLNRS